MLAFLVAFDYQVRAIFLHSIKVSVRIEHNAIATVERADERLATWTLTARLLLCLFELLIVHLLDGRLRINYLLVE